MMSLDTIDLTSMDAFVEGVPFEWFATLRREAPIFWHPEPDGGPGFWCLTRYEDVVTVNRDNQTFSSARGGVFMWDMAPADLDQQRLMMLNMDPPMHTRYRRLVNKGFTPRMMTELEQTARERARAILDKVTPRGECDFVTDVAAELPLQVIADILGVPQTDRHKMFDWSNRMVGSEDPEYAVSDEEAQLASMELFAYAAQLSEVKRAEPGADLISVLSEAEVDGERLSQLEIDLFFMLLTVAGNETTRNQISHGLLALLEHPDQLALLRAQPDLLPSAIEEMLRFASPVMHFRRTATQDLMLGDTAIKEGDKIVIWYVSANRDEAVFEDPMRFNIERTPNDHVAFGGGGPHFCLGANLARLEIRVLFEEMLARWSDLELAGEPERLRSNFINGIKHIPLRFSAA
jgi:cholest-4-en-3-one 26-monooxygenase